MKFWFSKYHL